jgi:2-polyprenyl-3-methyl-5-hydroxy-6-metoxy-1,4-benzoquinol methylase
MSSINNSSAKIHEKYHDKIRTSHSIIKENNFTYRHLLSTIDLYIKTPPTKILDIGCGAGTLSLYYASKGHNVLGIDISQKAINAASKSAEQMNINNAVFKKIPFPEKRPKGVYDSIIFTEVIEHLQEDVTAIRTINSLLKQNGILILSTPSINAPLHRLKLTASFDKKVGHLRRYSLQSLINLLKENGFRIVRVKKTEGILRNFLFTNPFAGKLIRYINFFGSDFVTNLDNLSLKLFGESNYIIVGKKLNKKSS